LLFLCSSRERPFVAPLPRRHEERDLADFSLTVGDFPIAFESRIIWRIGIFKDLYREYMSIFCIS